MSPLEQVLKRDRWVVLGALAVVASLAWIYTLSGAGTGMTTFEMTRLGSMPMQEQGTGMTMDVPSSRSWTIEHSALMLAMWWTMMVAMMLPSAAPTILLAGALNRRSDGSHPPYGSVGCFISGYLTA